LKDFLNRLRGRE
jgi:hypothetical protein